MEAKDQIIQSLFSARSQDGHLVETYIAHLKVWEDVPASSGQPDAGTKKSRYLMLAVTLQGKVLLHKGKRNNNGSFSKGKTWNLEDLGQVEVVTPQTFALSMTSRTYIWSTERPRDQQVFLATICKIYRKYTQGNLPNLKNLNFTIDEVPTNSVSPTSTTQQALPGSNILAPPPLRSRQGSHSSSVTSSALAGAGESFYTAAGSSRGAASTSGRPSMDSVRQHGSFSSTAGSEREGHAPRAYTPNNGSAKPYDQVYGSERALNQDGPFPMAALGQTTQQYTPVPGMGSHSAAKAHPVDIPKSSSQRSLQSNPQAYSSIPHSSSVSSNLTAESQHSSHSASRPALGERTPTMQSNYAFKEKAIPPPAHGAGPGPMVGLGERKISASHQPLYRPPPQQQQAPPSQPQDQEVEQDDEAFSESAMPTPVPGQHQSYEYDDAYGGFDEAPPAPIPPVAASVKPLEPSHHHDQAGVPSLNVLPPKEAAHFATNGGKSAEREKKRGMLKPLDTSSSATKPSKPVEHVHFPTEAQTSALPLPQQPEIPPQEQGESQKRARRPSFVPPPTTTPYSRDLLLGGGSFSQAEALLGDDNTDQDGTDLEDATMANVEEILDGFDWGADSYHHGQSRSQAGFKGGMTSQLAETETIESRLMDESNALEAANIHAFLESDDRIKLVLNGIDEAVKEMDKMDVMLGGWKLQLGGMTEDIAFIESQNRGLQVQTANQMALLKELEQLLENVSVDPDELRSLTQESLESERGVQKLESSLATLYKALLAIRDRDTNDMAAAAGRKDEYETYNRQFCQRLVEYLVIMIKFQAETAASVTAAKASQAEIQPHAQMEQKLGMYCGLILYMVEMDEDRYQKLCTNYFSSASELHSKEIKGLFMTLIGKLKKPTEDERDESSFTSAAALGTKSGAIQRSKTMMGNLRTGDRKDKQSGGRIKAADALDKALGIIAIQLGREEAFIADFLHITDSMLTYADYMDLDSYFRRQAVRFVTKGMKPSTVKLRRSALDLIFGFVAGEIKDWVEGALQRDRIQIFGMMAVCEKAIRDAEDRSAIFYLNILQKQMQRLQNLVERYLADQVKAIENAQLTNKKRRGVVFFIKHFPVFVSRVESQLGDYGDYAARNVANAGYEQIVNAMFDALQHMAKMDRSDVAGEDKGQLNHSIIMIENLHFYVQDAAKHDIAALNAFMERAQKMYDDNMTSYIRAVLRRSFGKPRDFFDAVQKQLRTSSPQEISSSPSYNRSQLKRAVKDISSGKDMRKAVDALVKRVEKHYSLDESDLAGTDDALAMSNEAASLIASVTQSCEKILVTEVGKWSKIMGQCYAEAAASGVGLEYGPTEVENAFKKARA